jgi:hypothetical protein
MGLTLREGNREYFYKKLDEHFPGLKQKYQKKYGYSYEIMSENNNLLMDLFQKECSKSGIVFNNNEIFRYLHTYEESSQIQQLSLF